MQTKFFSDTEDCEDPCPECTSCNADFWPDLVQIILDQFQELPKFDQFQQCSADGDNIIGDPIELVPDRFDSTFLINQFIIVAFGEDLTKPKLASYHFLEGLLYT